MQQSAAATEAALHAELASLRIQVTDQGGHRCNTPLAAGDVRAECLCNQMQLGAHTATPGVCCEDDAAQAVSDDSADTDGDPISALLEALDHNHRSADLETVVDATTPF